MPRGAPLQALQQTSFRPFDRKIDRPLQHTWQFGQSTFKRVNEWHSAPRCDGTQGVAGFPMASSMPVINCAPPCEATRIKQDTQGSPTIQDLNDKDVATSAYFAIFSNLAP